MFYLDNLIENFDVTITFIKSYP